MNFKSIAECDNNEVRKVIEQYLSIEKGAKLRQVIHGTWQFPDIQSAFSKKPGTLIVLISRKRRQLENEEFVKYFLNGQYDMYLKRLKYRIRSYTSYHDSLHLLDFNIRNRYFLQEQVACLEFELPSLTLPYIEPTGQNAQKTRQAQLKLYKWAGRAANAPARYKLSARFLSHPWKLHQL